MFSIFVSTFYHGDYRCITLQPLELQDEAEKHRTEAFVKVSSQAGHGGPLSVFGGPAVIVYFRSNLANYGENTNLVNMQFLEIS